MTYYYSSVPAAITALLTAFRTSTALGLAAVPVPVRAGPQLTAAAALEAVAVGYASAQNASVVSGTSTAEGLGTGPDRERYTIACTAEVLDPGADMGAARTRAYQLHAACGAAIAVDRTLGGKVLRATAGLGSLEQQQQQNGALARVTFGVDIDAYTTR